ncbi:glycoside hydrolase family 18 protein [Allosphingosinicella flava]|uniref:chitinase n=1 Tax=Allosphingosinicella flava TaxID=2771430 RepID=A0A7T2GJC2_9SPHN|nr:glycosyl hydrolase family 18 protein [Sphingosinicella flava]QPQ54943.1 glycoside hydrolase family 18 protein [Sphingosinicella flava]
MKIALPFLAAILLTGCGGEGSSSSPPPSPPPPSPSPPPPAQITVSPAQAQIGYADTQQLSCSVAGHPTDTCTWTLLDGPSSGRITETGLYVAPLAQGNYRVVATSIADPTRSATATVSVVPMGEPAYKPWVTGYYGWTEYPVEEVDMGPLSHLVIYGVVAASSFGPDVQPGDLEEMTGYPIHGEGGPEERLVRRAHDKGVKALLMLDGSGNNDSSLLVATTDAARPRFITNILNRLRADDYDGIAINWLKVRTDFTNLSEEEVRRRYKALLVDLRAAARNHPSYGSQRPLIITVAATAPNIFGLADGRVPAWQAEIPSLVDQYNVTPYGQFDHASYFPEKGGSSLSWFNGAIGGAAPEHPYDLASAIAAYTRAGVDPRKLGVGIVFNGTYYGPDVTGPRQPIAASTIFEGFFLRTSYRELARLGYLINGTYRWDPVAQVGYRSYPGGGFAPTLPSVPHQPPNLPAGFLSYEDEMSIAVKGHWVRRNSIGGVALWRIDYGYLPDSKTNPLLSAVGTAFPFKR